MSIGTMRCVALNVTDHDLGLRFWSALTGYEVLDPGYWGHGWLAYQGTTESCGHPGHPPGYKHEIILIHTDNAPIETPVPTHHHTNCVHIDITPNHGREVVANVRSQRHRRLAACRVVESAE